MGLRAVVIPRRRAGRGLDRYNRAFYERCWRAGSVLPLPGVVPPGPAARRLEVGCGLRPRLPLAGTVFLDVSRTACAKLRRAGARAVCASIAALPLADASVEVVQAYDVLEHLEDDRGAVAELVRVLAPGGLLVLSTPLHARHWQEYDRVVGHARRYDPAALVALVGAQGLTLEGFAPFGMRPRSRLLNRLGIYYLTRWPRTAFRVEERFLRLVRPADAAVPIRRGGGAEFLTAARALDGAVTAWRRTD
jgi:SAM-dependent methyltransferase